MYVKKTNIFLCFKTEEIFLQLPGALEASDRSSEQGCHNDYLQKAGGKMTSCSNCVISITNKYTFQARKYIFSPKEHL